jgi:hypothetical protein
MDMKRDLPPGVVAIVDQAHASADEGLTLILLAYRQAVAQYGPELGFAAVLKRLDSWSQRNLAIALLAAVRRLS